MRCPFCGYHDTQVKDSRPTEDNLSIRRRRFCPKCQARFGTFERVQFREIIVTKKNGQRRPFDRDKLIRSINIAIRKREIMPAQVEKLVSNIVGRIETSGNTEVSSQKIGEMVMEELAQLDQVAYVRFASVYRDFREVKDFSEFIERNWQKDKPKKKS